MNIWNDFYIENSESDLNMVWSYVPTDAKNILEVGVCSGGSLKYWTEKIPEDGIIIGVDRDPNIFRDITGGCPTRKSAWTIEHMISENVAKLVSSREVYVVRGSSAESPTRQLVEELMGDRQLDFYFHDGMHYGITPINDWNNLGHLLRIGGTLCVADTHLERQPNLVARADIGHEVIGTNQLVYRLPEWKATTTKLSTRQEMVVWTKDQDFVAE